MTVGIDLNSLIGSRICHDLISPLGAIGNGVELLTMSGVTAAPEIALIAESVENANARIRFFRVSYGAAPADSSVSNSDIRSILRDMFKGSRLTIDWRVNEDLPRREVKLAFLLIQCLEAALPRGGKIHVTKTGSRWHLVAASDRLKIKDELWNLLAKSTDVSEVLASDVQFALAPQAAATLGRKLTVMLDDNTITVSF